MRTAPEAVRLLVVSAFYPPHHLGGYELICADVVESMRARGHEVHVLTSRHRATGARPDASPLGGSLAERGPVATSSGRATPPSPPARRALGLHWRDGVWRRPGLAGAVAATRRDLTATRAAMDAVRPDALWAWQMAAISKVPLTEARDRGIPVVLSFLDLWPTYDLATDPWFRWCRGRRAALGAAVGRAAGLPTDPPDLRDAAGAAYGSAWLRGRLAGPGLAPPGPVIHPGVELARFAAVPGLARPVRRFLLPARIEPRKGQLVAVEALTRLRDRVPDATLTLAGHSEGGHLETVLARALDLGVAGAVRHAGPVPPGDLPALYAAHDAVIHAATWEEPFGRVLVEALAAGRPLVASPTGGAAEIVEDDRTALTFAPGDAAGCAARMEELAGDGALAERLVAAGREAAARFTHAREVAAHEELVASCLR